MCGLVGFLQEKNFSADDEKKSLLLDMANRLEHRGPDSLGHWLDPDDGIGLAHRRLKIIDLSEAGAQPMISSDLNMILVFNGEIYNHIEIREALLTEGKVIDWRGHSDTETLLESFLFWGIEKTLSVIVGMFAFALWDRSKRSLTIGRDRLGEKPLYYGWQGEGSNKVFLFGSELKSLKVHPSFVPEVDREALKSFMRFGYVPTPHSIYRNISKLPPGNILSVSSAEPTPVITPYWDIRKIATANSKIPFDGAGQDLVSELDSLLRNSIKLQMVSDVPLGVFLSGGIDSSAVASIMQQQSKCPIKTYTLGFEEQGYDEAKHARAIASHLGTDHNELYVSADKSLELIPKLAEIYCEPFADSSQIPTFLVAQLAKSDVTVALSGDGADEVFGGYNRYVALDKYWPVLDKLPIVLREFLAKALLSVPPNQWDSILTPIDRFLPKPLRFNNAGQKIHKTAGVVASATIGEVHQKLVSAWNDPSQLVKSTTNTEFPIIDVAVDAAGLDEIHTMMLIDTENYLPDDILVKVDRASMANSLEVRAPFLDHRILEFAWNLPKDMKIRNGQGKWILRQVLNKYVPKELFERPKMGFQLPIAEWLRGPLRDWGEALLDERRLREEGFFYPEPIRAKWCEHQSAERDWSSQLWAVLMFQSWLEMEKL